MSDLNNYQELLARHDYAIIDLTGREAADLWKNKLSLKDLVPFALRHSGGILPSYVDLKTLNEEQTGLLCRDLQAAEGDEFRPIISSLVSCPPHTDEDAFTAHFMNHMVMSYPQRRFLLRFWDSRAFLQLRRIIAKEQFFCLYAGIVKEWTVFFQGEWISFTAPEIESVRADWQVTNEEYAQIERILIINEAITAWKEEQGKRFADLNELDFVSVQLDKVIKVGEEEYQLNPATDDLSQFALHALLYGMAFYKHPWIQGIMKSKSDENWSYSANVAEKLDETHWKKIAATAPYQSITI